MPTLSDVDRALYALGYVKREFEFSGMEDAYTKVTLDDGTYEEIDVLAALGNAITKMQLYEVVAKNDEKFTSETIKESKNYGLEHSRRVNNVREN